MKDMKYYLRFIVLMLCVSFVACNDDDKETAPIFPELQKMECAVGDEQTFTFDAVSDWTLTSSALWCTFLVDGEEAFSCSGTAGKQSVTIKINDDATELMKSYKAELTLIMGGAKQVICEVTRPMTGEELHVFNRDQTVEYTAENPFGKNYDERQYLSVSANTDWVVECSEGLMFDSQVISGLAGDNVELELVLKSGFTKSAWKGSLTFKNKKNEIISNVPVNYEGIPADRIELGGLNPYTPIPFSHDGSSYTLNSEKLSAPMPITVVAKDDQYVSVLVNYVEKDYEYTCTIASERDKWFELDSDDEAGNLELGLYNNRGEERTGYLLVFPKAVYDKIKDDFEAQVFSREEGIVEAYTENIAVNIKQAGDPKFTTGFAITDGEGNPLLDENGAPIQIMSGADIGMDAEALIAKYHTSNVAMLSLPSSKDYGMVVAKPNGFSGNYIDMSTSLDGKETIWNGVKVDYYSMLELSIEGLASNVTGAEEMVITCMDNGEVYAVLLIARY